MNDEKLSKFFEIDVENRKTCECCDEKNSTWTYILQKMSRDKKTLGMIFVTHLCDECALCITDVPKSNASFLSKERAENGKSPNWAYFKRTGLKRVCSGNNKV